jgi:hypothetical protein
MPGLQSWSLQQATRIRRAAEDLHLPSINTIHVLYVFFDTLRDMRGHRDHGSKKRHYFE